MKHLSLLWICLFFLLGSQSLHASHIAAADISYECLGNNNYEFTLRLFRDCRGISVQSNYQIDIIGNQACNNNTRAITLYKISQIEIPTLCADSSSNALRICNATGNGSSTGFGYQEVIYKGRINLSSLQGCSWTASWTECCRNGAITTGGTNALTYIYTSKIDANIVCNNSPVLNNTPVFVVCDSSLQDISNAMLDPDGDSLAYSLANPLSDANQPIVYSAGFSPTQPLPTGAGGFQFNTNSGQNTFLPVTPQVTIVDILIDEYRNGQLIGQSQRTIQIAVVNCNNNKSLTLDQVSRQVNGTWQTQGTSTTFDICPGELLNFRLELSDLNAADTLFLNEAYSSLLRTYPNATVQESFGASTNELIVDIAIPTTQIGTFTLGFNDNACPLFDLQTFGINLVPSANCARLTGRVFMDDNLNCAADAGENTVPLVSIAIDKGNNPLVVPVDGQGYFSVLVDTGTYQITVNTNSLFRELCPTVQSFTISNLMGTANVDLPIQTTASCPLLTVDIGANVLIHCMQNIYFINYCNQGNVTAYNATVDITLDSLFVVDSSSLPILSQNGFVYTFDLDSIPPGYCGSFQINGTLDTACDLAWRGRVHCATAHIYPDTICVGWAGPQLQVEGRCVNDSVSFRIHNVGQQAMSGPRNPLVLIDNFILNTGSSVNLAAGASSPWVYYPATGVTYRVEIDQEVTYPWGLSAAAVVEGCVDTNLANTTVSTGMVNTFSLDNGAPYFSIDCQPNVGSYDPNDKQAFPTGYGLANYIKVNEDLKYRIRFQNTGTSRARRVVLIDTLSPYLDPETIVPAVASHPYMWYVREGNILEIYFNNINLPAARFDSLGSQGFIDFKIKQQPNNPLGSVINNKAAIYFDFNPPIITNTVFHTIDENFITFVNLPSLEQGDDLTVLAFPNPFDQATTLRVKDSKNYQELHVQVYNALGQLMDQVSNTTGEQEITIQRKNLPTGIYFYRLEGDGQLLHAGQLSVQ